MTKRVEISWSREAAKVMSAPGRYVAPATFPSERDTSGSAWSVVLEFEELHHGTARFLVNEAPHELIESGVTFEMYAGKTLAATVKVL
jgi:hypothetical protein